MTKSFRYLKADIIIVFIIFVVASCLAMGDRSKHIRLCVIKCANIIKHNVTTVDPAFIPLQLADYRGKLFVSSPRVNPKMLVSLAEVHIGNFGYCKFAPYPSWERNNMGCEGFFSVSAIKVDCCGRLWILDGGIVNLNKRQCSPKLTVMDIRTNTVLHEVYIPKKYIQANNFFLNMEVDIRKSSCENAYVYLPDIFGYALCVFDYHCSKYKSGKTCWSLILAKEFAPVHHYAAFSDGNSTVLYMTGIYGITNGPKFKDITGTHYEPNEWFYFHPLAGVYEYRMETSYLRNFNNNVVDNQGHGTGYTKALRKVELLGKRSSRASGQAMTKNGIMFQSLIDTKSIACWDSRMPYQRPFIHNLTYDELIFGITLLTIEENGRCAEVNNNNGNLMILSSNSVEFTAKNFSFTCKKEVILIAFAPIDVLLDYGKCWLPEY